jgi:hypothetical protein
MEYQILQHWRTVDDAIANDKLGSGWAGGVSTLIPLGRDQILKLSPATIEPKFLEELCKKDVPGLPRVFEVREKYALRNGKECFGALMQKYNRRQKNQWPHCFWKIYEDALRETGTSAGAAALLKNHQRIKEEKLTSAMEFLSDFVGRYPSDKCELDPAIDNWVMDGDTWVWVDPIGETVVL